MVKIVDPKLREKRERIVARVQQAHRDDPAEAKIAKQKLRDIDERAKAEAAKHREWGDGKSALPKPEPVVTEDEKREFALTTLGPLQQALAQATVAGDITALKDVAAMATALKAGAKARGLGIVSENQASEVILRAERAIGAILREVPRAKRGPKPGTGGRRPDGTYATGSTGLGDQTLFDEVMGQLGINLASAAKLQMIAALSDDEFEALIEEKRAANARLAKVDFYRAVRQPTEDEKAAALARAEAKEEATTPVVASFEQVAEALIEGMDQVPNDDLVVVAGLIVRLLEAYKQVFNDRKGVA